MAPTAAEFRRRVFSPWHDAMARLVPRTEQVRSVTDKLEHHLKISSHVLDS